MVGAGVTPAGRSAATCGPGVCVAICRAAGDCGSPGCCSWGCGAAGVLEGGAPAGVPGAPDKAGESRRAGEAAAASVGLERPWLAAALEGAAELG
jgi:hypothetical protein